MYADILGRDARIIVDKFYLGDKILDSFMNLFTKDEKESILNTKKMKKNCKNWFCACMAFMSLFFCIMLMLKV